MPVPADRAPPGRSAGPDGAPRRGDAIALYGTLLRGARPFDSLGLADALHFLGPCVIAGKLYDLGDYPGLRPGLGRVVGELFALLDADVIPRLDAFEGYDPADRSSSLYRRDCVRLVEPNDTVAWLYVYNRAPETAARIPQGDWRAHRLTMSATLHAASKGRIRGDGT